MYVHPDSVFPLCEAVTKQAFDDIVRGGRCVKWTGTSASGFSKRSSALRDLDTALAFFESKKKPETEIEYIDRFGKVTTEKVYGLTFSSIYKDLDGRYFIRKAREKAQGNGGRANYRLVDKGIVRGRKED